MRVRWTTKGDPHFPHLGWWRTSVAHPPTRPPSAPPPPPLTEELRQRCGTSSEDAAVGEVGEDDDYVNNFEEYENDPEFLSLRSISEEGQAGAEVDLSRCTQTDCATRPASLSSSFSCCDLCRKVSRPGLASAVPLCRRAVGPAHHARPNHRRRRRSLLSLSSWHPFFSSVPPSPHQMRTAAAVLQQAP